jgi:hypothetical protein
MKFKKVFILGQARSGTSIIRGVLSDLFGYPSNGEGHILNLITRRFEVTTNYLNTFSNLTDDISIMHLKEIDFFELDLIYMKEIYSKLFPAGVFLDKTPSSEAAHCWRFILEGFPDAAIIFCIRNPIEVLESSAKKFDNFNFEAVCIEYSGCIEAIRKAVSAGYSERIFIADYRFVAREPSIFSEKVLNFFPGVNGNTDLVCSYLRNNWKDNLTQNPDDPNTRINLSNSNYSNNEFYIKYCSKYVSFFESRPYIEGEVLKEFLEL